MQDIVKGWWLFNNEIHASSERDCRVEWGGKDGIPHVHITSCIEIKPSGIASLKVSLNERPKLDERTPFKPSLTREVFIAFTVDIKEVQLARPLSREQRAASLD